MNNRIEQLKRSIRNWILLFIVCLIASGLTAFPIETELALILKYTRWLPPGLHTWMHQTYIAINATNTSFPQLSYGTDWLAFAHLIIGIVFLGVMKDPVRNVWILQTGVLACILVIPVALIAGYIREIPFFWQMIDCSFGIIGLIPLVICLHKVRELEKSTSGL